MTDLRGQIARAEAELKALAARPLSVRHALLVAALIDHLADVAFTAQPPLAGLPAAADVLGFRAALRAACPALGRLADLCGMGAGAPVLRIEAVPVPPGETDALTTAEFMVSLYNGYTVPRVVIATADGAAPVLPLLRAGLAFWRGVVA